MSKREFKPSRVPIEEHFVKEYDRNNPKEKKEKINPIFQLFLYASAVVCLGIIVGCIIMIYYR